MNEENRLGCGERKGRFVSKIKQKKIERENDRKGVSKKR